MDATTFSLDLLFYLSAVADYHRISTVGIRLDVLPFDCAFHGLVAAPSLRYWFLRAVRSLEADSLDLWLVHWGTPPLYVRDGLFRLEEHVEPGQLGYAGRLSPLSLLIME